MKSLKESLGLSRTVLSIDGIPKSAVGILTHQEDNKLYKLWIDIMKAEEAHLKLSSESAKYCSSLREIQNTEEKLVKLLGDSNIAIHSPLLRQIMDEYLSVIIEMKRISEATSSTAHEVMGVSPDQYHALYEQLDAFRKKRDLLIGELERCQDKLDRLKLKGKRTTDFIVEKEKNLRHFRETNSKLMNEAEKFHNLRVNFLQTCIQASVHNQINYYGSVTSEFNKYVELSRGTHQIRENQYMKTMNSHLNQIKQLTIVDQ